MVIHDSTIGGDATQIGGGGGVSCTPIGIFAKFGSPVYSDYEDNTIGGNLRVTGLDSCWLGGLRNKIGGSVTFSNNTLADPDANEILTNHIAGNLLCSDNSPAMEYGDSRRLAQRGRRLRHRPVRLRREAAEPGTVPGPTGNPAGPLTPIAIPSTTPQGYWLEQRTAGCSASACPSSAPRPASSASR